MMKRPMHPDEYVYDTSGVNGSTEAGVVHYIRSASGIKGAYRVWKDGKVEWFKYDNYGWDRVAYIEPFRVPGMGCKDLFS